MKLVLTLFCLQLFGIRAQAGDLNQSAAKKISIEKRGVAVMNLLESFIGKGLRRFCCRNYVRSKFNNETARSKAFSQAAHVYSIYCVLIFDT